MVIYLMMNEGCISLKFLNQKPTSEKLQKYVQLFWVNRHDEMGVFGEKKPKLPPHGASNLIFNFGTAYAKKADGEGDVIQSHIKGPSLHYYEIHQEKKIDILGIAFKPYGLYAFTDFPMKQLVNQVIDIEKIDDFFVSLFEDLKEIEDDAKRMGHVEKALLGRLNEGKKHLDIVMSFVEIVGEQKGMIKAEDIAEQLHISLKTLERKCQAVLGLTPKNYIRTVRFNYALSIVRFHQDNRNWIEVATDCGYYDQSHFIREFKSFTGYSPEKYQTVRDLIGDFYLKM